MKTMANPTCSVRRVLGRLSHRQGQGETARVTASGSEVGHTFARPGRGRRKPPEETGSGCARSDQAGSGLSLGSVRHLLRPFDEWSADYECVLKSDTYRLGEYVGDSVWV